MSPLDAEHPATFALSQATAERTGTAHCGVVPQADPRDTAAGRAVADRYRLEEVLGVGGGGQVFAATDLRTQAPALYDGAVSTPRKEAPSPGRPLWALVALALVSCAADGGPGEARGDTGHRAAEDTGPDPDDRDGDGVPADEDCDDVDATVGAPTAWYRDADGDGHGDPATEVLRCQGEFDELPVAGDCDDSDAEIHPGASETCDGRDQDCDGRVDEEVAAAPSWYLDGDGDGYGDPDDVETGCEAPAGRVAANTDCDDSDSDVHPGAVERCGDAVDQDCDGDVGGLLAGEVFTSDAHGVAQGSPDQWAGSLVENMGDVSGDGVDDVLVGGIEAGESWLLSGPLSGTSALSSVIRFTGSNSGPTGRSADAVGDVNGDGVADLLLGAFRAAYTQTEQGAAYMVLGPVTQDTSVDLAAFSLVGTAEYDRLGMSVAGAGDLDGDGIHDVVAGAGHADDGAPSGGVAYVVFGPVSGRLSAGDADLRIAGGSASGAFGSTMSSRADLDGDGRADLVVGAPYADVRIHDDGGAYVFLDLGAEPALDEDAEVIISGAEKDDQIGTSLSTGPDATGDGAPDLALGIAFRSGSHREMGAAWLSDGPLVAGRYTVDDLGLLWTGESEWGLAGYSVKVGPDLDGDGSGELFAGGYNDSGGNPFAGSAWIVQGPITTGGELAHADIVVRGNQASATGWAFDVADLDGDGNPSLLIGAPGEELAGYNDGAIYSFGLCGAD